jgi:hypothetical protein
MTFIQAYHSSAGDNLPASRVVIHGTVSATVPGGAVATARYFQSPNSGGSAPYVVDPNEIVQCATDNTICWHAPPNKGSIGVEFCDWVTLAAAQADPRWRGKSQAEFDARWALPEWDKMLRLGAGLVHTLCVKYGIPITKISVAQLLAGGHGICGHVDVSQAWHQTDHTDPGASFPWATFMGYVLGAAGPGYVAPVVQPVHYVPTPGVLTVDGAMGPATITKWQQVMHTPVDGRISSPKSSLVIAVQHKLIAAGFSCGASGADGAGIAQDNRKYNTVAALQRYLGTYVDGVLSLPSSGCVKALQTRLNTNRF